MSLPAETLASRQVEYVTLVVNAQQFCIDIMKIREIRRWSPVTPIPHAPDYVLGIINLRGAVIPIIDLALKLGFEKIQPTDRHVIMIITHHDRTIGILVESVSEILGINIDEIHDTPIGLDDVATASITGLVPSKSDIIKILDIPSLLNLLSVK